jgi:hypothetical protein
LAGFSALGFAASYRDMPVTVIVTIRVLKSGVPFAAGDLLGRIKALPRPSVSYAR